MRSSVVRAMVRWLDQAANMNNTAGNNTDANNNTSNNLVAARLPPTIDALVLNACVENDLQLQTQTSSNKRTTATANYIASRGENETANTRFLNHSFLRICIRRKRFNTTEGVDVFRR